MQPEIYVQYYNLQQYYNNEKLKQPECLRLKEQLHKLLYPHLKIYHAAIKKLASWGICSNVGNMWQQDVKWEKQMAKSR